MATSSSPPPPLPDPGDAHLDRLVHVAAGTASRKWTAHPGCVPLWVADSDFRSPPAVREALAAAAAQGTYGYTDPSPELKDVVCAHFERVYGFETCTPEMLRWMPALVPGLNHMVRAAAAMGRLDPASTAVAVATPIYSPFLAAPVNNRAAVVEVPLASIIEEPHGLRYGLDLEALDDALARPEVTCLLWCNPHNPTGRVWTRDELKQVAECCVRHNVFIQSDEVWGELVLEPEKTPFVGMASLIDEVPGLRERLVVMTSTSKTYNVASTDCAVAAIPDESLRRAFARTSRLGYVPESPFGERDRSRPS